MSLGPFIVITWFALVISSLIIAITHLVKRKAKGILLALASTVGAIFMGAFVSAWIGSKEVVNYTQEFSFQMSVIIGAAGLALFAWSCFRLKTTPAAV
jgi:predicted MFS family arabinose efflux permease